MESYCPKCDKLSEVMLKAIAESFNVKGEKIDTTSEVAYCNSCGDKIFNQELDDKNLDLTYAIYRKKHNLLSPIEIVNIRKKYSLSQRSLARLLEWGEITINRYESGAIQDPVHNEVLMFIIDPKNMKEMFEKNSHLLSKSAREKLQVRIEEFIKQDLSPQFRVSVEDYLTSKHGVDEYSGFTNFDLEKMINMILYIAEKMQGVFTTKLNKLLWYIDFLNFKEYSKSISGSNYVHLPLGPVPDNYRWIIAVAIDENLLDQEETVYPSGYSGEKYIAMIPPEISLFSEEEKKIMDYVINHFKNYKCGQIKDVSHKEKAYLDTRDNEKISYKYATSLSISLSGK